MERRQANEQMNDEHPESAAQAEQAEHNQRTGERTETRASVRPSVSALLPSSSEPETPEQRMGAGRNSAYHEKVTVRQVDPQEERAQRRLLVTIGLEVALAVILIAARRIWGWAREERARAHVDRELRRRLTAR